MADLEQSLAELESVKQAFKTNINSNGVSTSGIEFRSMPNLLKQMEKKLPSQTKTVDPTTSSQSVSADAGYKLTAVNINAVKPSDYYKPEESITIQPKTTPQVINPPIDHVFNLINVSAVTSDIDSNIQEENIKEGVTILGKTGTFKGGITPTGAINITKNGTYDVTEYASAEINVQPTLQEKSVTPTKVTQDITSDSGYDGLSKVSVNAIPSEYIVPTGTKSITENGTHTVTEYANVEVNVPSEEPTLIQKEITVNGTYSASKENVDGYSVVVVNVPTSGGGTSEVEIVLPSEFGDLTSINYHKATDDIILFASPEFSGIWEYVLSTETLTKVNSSRYFSTMHTLVNGNCIFTDPGNGVFVYDPISKTIVASSTTQAAKSVWTAYHNTLDGNCLLGGKKEYAKGVLLYNVETGTFSSTGTYDTHLYFQDLPDGDCLIGSAAYGFIRYNSVEKKLVTMSNVSYGMYFRVLSNGDCLVGGNSTGGGLWIYDATAKTMTQIYANSTYGWNYFYELPNGKTLVSGSNSSYSKGIIVYDPNTKTATRPYTTGYNFQYFKSVENGGALISSPNANGILYYNATDDTFTSLLSGGTRWSAYHDLPNGNILIGSTYDSTSATTGVCLYKADTNTITKIYPNGYYFTIFENLPDGNVKIKSEKFDKTLLYDATTESIRVYSVLI